MTNMSGADAVYRQANLDWVSDPITIARHLGLSVAPLRGGEGNYVGRRTGLNVFMGVAEFCGCDVGDLVMPRAYTRLMPLETVISLQVFAPKNFLVARYTETNGSGVIGTGRSLRRA